MAPRLKPHVGRTSLRSIATFVLLRQGELVYERNEVVAMYFLRAASNPTLARDAATPGLPLSPSAPRCHSSLAGLVRSRPLSPTTLLRFCARLLTAVVPIAGCTEDGVEPGDADAALAPRDSRGSGDTASADTPVTGRPDASSPDVAPPSDAGIGGELGPPSTTDGGDPPARDSGSIPPLDAECDLRGRWLVSQRFVAEAVGEKQGSHSWYYLEVRHEGASITVQKGLHCGYNVTPITPLGGKVDCSAAWPSFLAENSSTGRRGTFVKRGSACHLRLEPEYTARGVTLPHYLDPAHPLPTASQPAQGIAPGWEDWDSDGNPGITLNVSGLASGKIYSAQRERTTYEGDVPFAAAKFKVPISVGTENVVLGRMGPILLESPSSISADASQHYAWLARLADDQARGSDTEICLAVRALKGQLVPEGDQ
jgi:hypothetical protein